MFTFEQIVFGLIFSAVLCIGGGAMIRDGFTQRRQRQLIQDTPTERIGSLSMGPSEVKGDAHELPDEGTITAPFSDEECLVATWKVEEWDESRADEEDDPIEGQWRKVASGTESVPFLVDDGSGTLLVDPDGADFDLDEETEPPVEIPVTEEPPAAIQRFIEREDRVGNAIGDPDEFGEINNYHREGDRRYTQSLLRPGETAYVFGTVQPHEHDGGVAGAQNRLIRKVTEEDDVSEPLFLVSDRSESDLIASRRFALWHLPAGSLLVTGGVAGFVIFGGPFVGIETAPFIQGITGLFS